MRVDYVVPSNLYPRKQFILPNIMSQTEVKKIVSVWFEFKGVLRCRSDVWLRDACQRGVQT